MAGFVLFEDVLTPDDVKSLYALGPKLFNSLQGVQELTGSQRTGLFSQKKARPVLFYSPKVRVDYLHALSQSKVLHSTRQLIMGSVWNH